MKKGLIIAVLLVVFGSAAFFMFRPGPTPATDAKKSDISVHVDHDEDSTTKKVTATSASATRALEVAQQRIDAFQARHAQIGATEEQKEKVKLIGDVVKTSGVADEFLALDEMIDAQVAQLQGLEGVSEEDKAKFEATLRSIFNGNEMLSDLMEEYKKNMTVEELKELAEIHKDPLLIKEAEANQRLRSEDGQREFMEFMNKQRTEPMTEENKTFAKEMDKATGMSENATKTFFKMMDTMQASMPKPPGKGPTAEQQAMMDKNQESFRKHMGETIGAGTQAHLVFTHAQNSKEEKAQLLKQHSSGSMQKERDIKNGVINRALESDNAKAGIKDMMHTAVKPKADINTPEADEEN